MVGVMEAGSSGISLGDRVEVGDQRGTVLYVGPVPPAKGVWLGVDWDDPLRGKHNGVYEGIRYFQARYETSGSFVRIEKISRRQDIISAIQDRYGGNDQQMDVEQLDEIKKALNAPLLMMVGFDEISKKQSCFSSLTVISLREYGVYSPGKPGLLGEMCPSVMELDLSRSLINSWNVIHQITSQLKWLQLLDISENRLSYKDCNPEKLSGGFKRLECIILSKLEYSWEDLLFCALMWPQIKQLQVSFNRISILSTPPTNLLLNLEVLNLEGNNIVYWSEIEKLGTLPSLNVLNVSNVGLINVSLPFPNTLFPKLKYLLLSGNFINNWENISELDKLPSLDELRFRDNPILDGVSKDTARQIIIARITKLKILNTQEIPDEERRGAEIDYIKDNGRMWLETASNLPGRSAFNSLHPRYSALIQKYGEITEAELRKKAPTLKASLVKVKIESREGITHEKAIPDKMTIRALVFLVQRLFNTGTSKITLTLKSASNPSLKLPLDKMEKTVHYYSVDSGDIIRVDW